MKDSADAPPSPLVGVDVEQREWELHLVESLDIAFDRVWVAESTQDRLDTEHACSLRGPKLQVFRRSGGGEEECIYFYFINHKTQNYNHTIKIPFPTKPRKNLNETIEIKGNKEEKVLINQPWCHILWRNGHRKTHNPVIVNLWSFLDSE